ncbi:MAG: hypothetical protein K2W82_15970 [Candidatus Obscuribacterales bacterium]|nr:hypothetical protein [Candidatus Obscuribacterales bacterium]
MSFKKIGLVALGLAAVLAATVLCIKYAKPASDWPDFAPNQDKQPQVVVLVEPDFGYRTGDLVPVDIFIKQMPGSKVDIDSMALEGNFEIHGEAKVTAREFPDRSKMYRIKLVLQSFAVQRKLNASMSMVWEIENDPESKEIRQPLVEVFTSYTWDGREEIKDGPLSVGKGYHWQISLLLLLLSLGGFVWTLVAISRTYVNQRLLRSEHQLNTKEMICKRRVDAAFDQIVAGDPALVHFQEIDAAMREYLGVETVLLKDVPQALLTHYIYENQAMRLIIGCEKVLFRKLSLRPEEIAQMRTDADDILLQRFSFVHMNQDPGYVLPEDAELQVEDEEPVDTLPGPWDDQNPGE